MGAIDDDDEVRLYELDELPIFTIVLFLLCLDMVVDDDNNIDDRFDDGMSRVTNMAINASTEPKRNGGPGNKCFLLK